MKKTRTKKKVFLDTNVVLGLLKDDPKLDLLLKKKFLNDFEYIISPVVLQELYYTADNMRNKKLPKSTKLKKLISFFKVVEPSFNKSESILKNRSYNAFRNNFVHSNDVLNIITAINECDYFITSDKALLNLSIDKKLKILSPSKFISLEEGKK